MSEMNEPTDPRLAKRPAVLLLSDGARVELPDLSVGEAIAVVDLARGFGDFVGGDIDPERVVDIGYEEDT